MVEGSLWVYGQTDLADLYRERLTPRQVWVRIRSLPDEAPLWAVLRDEEEKADQRQKVDDIDALLAQFKPPKEG